MTNATLDIISEITNNELTISYECKTNHVLYSIADFGGNVIKRGDCHSVENNKLSISDLNKGIYMLCIIDGDVLLKRRFEKN